jgi:hypothetical protein
MNTARCFLYNDPMVQIASSPTDMSALGRASESLTYSSERANPSNYSERILQEFEYIPRQRTAPTTKHLLLHREHFQIENLF